MFAQYKVLAYVIAALALISAFGGYTAWVHHSGYASGASDVQEKWNAEKAAGIIEAGKEAVSLNAIDTTLQGVIHENEVGKPDLSVVATPDCVRDSAGVRPAPAHPGQPAHANGPPTSAAFGAAIIHDVNGYDQCLARLDAAQAALKVVARIKP